MNKIRLAHICMLISSIAAAQSLFGHNASAASADPVATKFELSSVSQSVEDYGAEWRRARKLMRACGAKEDTMAFVSFLEGVMIAMKAKDAKSRGEQVADDPMTYALGHDDFLSVTRSNCKRVAREFRPIIDDSGEIFDCRRKKAENCRPLPLYRAPVFD